MNEYFYIAFDIYFKSNPYGKVIEILITQRLFSNEVNKLLIKKLNLSSLIRNKS